MIPQFGNSSKDDRPPPPRVTYYYQEPPLHFNDNQRVTGIPELPAHITERELSKSQQHEKMLLKQVKEFLCLLLARESSKSGCAFLQLRRSGSYIATELS
ncbi:hypothetical protein TNCV_1826691 [Trichonephila clavipes]|nr:hypothetical protein TNCV_1826691 [Trichonephila clavipes]